MNVKKYILKLGALLFLMVLFFASSTKAQASVKKLHVMGTYPNKKSCWLDLNGDGKKEKLKLKWSGNEDALGKVKLYVDGKVALTLKDPVWVYHLGIDYIKMSKSKIFIRCYTSGDSYVVGSDYFYRYDPVKKKMIKAAKLLDINDNGISTEIKSVTSSEVKVAYCHNLDVIGHVLWTATYVVKDGKLKRKQGACKAKCAYTAKYGDSDGYGKLLEKSKYKAVYDLLFYTDGSMKKVAYYVKANEIVTLKKVKYTKGHWYVQFEKDGKLGWTNLQGYGSREIFYGVRVRMNVG